MILYRDMKIIVTGGNGFIGGHLVKRLLNEGHSVKIYDRKSGNDIKDFKLEGDEDFVIHLAAIANVRDSVKNPRPYFLTNVIYSKKIFEKCYEANIPCLYASSSSVHSWTKSPYGRSKKRMEHFAKPGQVGLRFSTTYGEDARKNMLFDFIKNKTVKYKTNHIRDFIYVGDVVEAIMIFVNTGLKNKNKTYEVCSGVGIFVKDLIERAGFNVPLVEGETCEAFSNVNDNSQLKRLGWKPSMDVYTFLNC